MNSNDKTHWHNVKALFKSARALPPVARESFLRERCGEDTALLADVSRLLGAETVDEFVGDIVLGAARETVAAAAADRLEQRVGNYRLIELLGTGGMGHVYRAERADKEFEHEVAIKLLHANLKGKPLQTWSTRISPGSSMVARPTMVHRTLPWSMSTACQSTGTVTSGA